MNSTLLEIKSKKIVSIIRLSEVNKNKIGQVVNTLAEGGVTNIEITLNTPGALGIVENLKKSFPEIKLGVGTVLDSESTRMAILSGADFLLSPTLNKEAITTSNRYNIPFIPGVLTPTEILQAYEFGAEMVKIFPISQLGPSYLKDIKAPLNNIDYMPVGGINENNLENYLDVGSFAVGIGSSLVDDNLVINDKFNEIRTRAEKLTSIVDKFTSENTEGGS